MTEEEFNRWVSEYIRVTGSVQDRTANLFAENSRIIGDRWKATYEELSEVTRRIVAKGSIPRFQDAILNTIRAELDLLRVERQPKNIKTWAVPYSIPSEPEREVARSLLKASGWVVPQKQKRRVKK